MPLKTSSRFSCSFANQLMSTPIRRLTLSGTIGRLIAPSAFLRAILPADLAFRLLWHHCNSCTLLSFVILGYWQRIGIRRFVECG
jgi:hypothetical protein